MPCREARALAACLGCLVTCFQRFLAFVNKNAYTDLAINSGGFCSGAMR